MTKRAKLKPSKLVGFLGYCTGPEGPELEAPGLLASGANFLAYLQLKYIIIVPL